MSDQVRDDWNPGTYLRFRGLRLRPALDLLNGVPDLPDGAVVDLGCGTGAMGDALSSRFPARPLVGVDSSPAMLEKASRASYDTLTEADAAEWAPETAPALIFSNALLHWLPLHSVLFPKFVALLADGGTLAVQMPRQFREPSHKLLRSLAAEMFPDRFDWSGWRPPVSEPGDYIALLAPFGDVTLWETTYHQRLQAVEQGHPVRAFTASTAARPILEKLNKSEQQDVLSAYDSALTWAYPASSDGSVMFPFKRLFFVLTKST